MKTIEWKTNSGKKVEVKIYETTTKEINLDGDKTTVAEYSLNIEAHVEGMGIIGTGAPWAQSNLPAGVATIGKLIMMQDNYDRVVNAIEDYKSNSTAYKADQAAKDENNQSENDYQAHCKMMSDKMSD